MLNIINIDMEKEVQQSFLDYAMYVNMDRALPDVRDGLKPVHRRILFAAHVLGLTPNKPYRKSARLVGDVIGKYHPHGDTSVYDAMVRMAQDWSMRYPLIDGQGNFGSIDGDGSAAMRYTEARMKKITLDMLSDIKKDVVDMKSNFSEDELEPTVLPSRVPNLLLNGTTGIGVAMACSFAPHNIVETIDAIIAQIKNEDITIEELHKILIAPDFPTGGIIINQRELIDAYKTGNGRARVRGRYKVEKVNRNREMIVLYEIPFGVAKEALISSIVKLCEEKKIEGIADVRDSSNKLGMRIEIELKKDVNPDVIANQLFKHTRLEDTFSINQVCLINGEPKLVSLKEMISAYISHQREVIERRTKFDLNKIDERLHILEGLLKALEDIDNVIAIIKNSSNAQNAIDTLVEKYSLSETQAKAIIDMKLRKLTGLEKIELENENKELLSQADKLRSILSDRNELDSVLINELEEMKKQHGDNRRTEVSNIVVKPEEKDIQFVQPEDVVVVVSKSGTLKKIPAKSYRVQNRNGVGVKNHDDIVMDVIKTNTIDNLMIFTALGRMYKLVVDQIPTGTNSSRGVSAHTLVKMEDHDRVVAITSMKRKTEAKYVVSISEQGYIKKTKIEEYASAKRSGIAAVGLKEGDAIADITFMNEEQILLITQNGMSIRFETKSINSVGRTAIGVRGMKLLEGDKVVAALPITKTTDEVAFFTSLGIGKRVQIKEFPVQCRDGKGTICYKPSKTTGVLVSSCLVENKDSVLIIGDSSTICISASDIPTLGKLSAGNILIKNNSIISVAKI